MPGGLTLGFAMHLVVATLRTRVRHIISLASNIIWPHRRLRAMHKMRSIATHVVRSVVCVSVCVSVLCTRMSCAKRSNRSRCYLVADYFGYKKSCIRMGSRSDRRIHSQPRCVTTQRDVAFCQITLDTLLLLISSIISFTIFMDCA